MSYNISEIDVNSIKSKLNTIIEISVLTATPEMLLLLPFHAVTVIWLPIACFPLFPPRRACLGIIRFAGATCDNVDGDSSCSSGGR